MGRATRTPVALFVLLCLFSLCSQGVGAQERAILGWVEKVRVLPVDVMLHAKLDTGADYSSIHAENIEEVTGKGNEGWVRFTLRNRYGVKKKVEHPIRRIARIKRHSGKHQKRYVINVILCVAGQYMEEEVNLVNRRHFEYQMLVGRSFLAGTFLVDPAATYTSDPDCPAAAEESSREIELTARAESIGVTNRTPEIVEEGIE